MQQKKLSKQEVNLRKQVKHRQAGERNKQKKETTGQREEREKQEKINKRVLALKAECLRITTNPKGEGEDKESLSDLLYLWDQEEWLGLSDNEGLMEELAKEIALSSNMNKREIELVLFLVKVLSSTRGTISLKEHQEKEKRRLTDQEYSKMLQDHIDSPAYDLEEGDLVELLEDYSMFLAGTKGYIQDILAFPVERDQEHYYIIDFAIPDRETGEIVWREQQPIPLRILRKSSP